MKKFLQLNLENKFENKLLSQLIKPSGFVIFFFFFGLLFLLKFKYLNLPFYFEERPYILVDFNNFSIWDYFTFSIPPRKLALHPFSFSLITSLLTNVFGKSPFVIHSIMLFYSSIMLSCIVFIFKKLTQKSTITLFLAPLILISYPNFFVHLTNFRFDIFTACIALLTIFFHLNRNIKLFFLSGLVLCYSRETVLAFLVTFLIIDLLDKKLSTKDRIKYISLTSLLLFVWSSFFIINHIKYDQFSLSDTTQETVRSILQYFEILTLNIRWLFIDDLRLFLSLLSTVSLFKFLKKKSKLPFELLYLILPIIFYLLGVSFHAYKATYYFYPIIPLLYLLFTFFITQFNLSFKTLILVFLLCLVHFFYLDNLKGEKVMRENSTDYKEIVSSYIEVSNYLHQNHFEDRINVEWPLHGYLKYPIFGYVPSGMKNINQYVNQFWSMADKDLINKHQLNCIEFRDNFDYVLIHEKSNGVFVGLQKEYVSKCEFELIKSFNFKEIKSNLYRKIIQSEI